jgi:uncharacterized protein YukE
LADRQKKLNRFLQAMGKKYTGSQKELHHALQELEERFKGLAKDAEGKSAGVTEALEKRFESETKELDTKIKELGFKLKSPDNIVQHHARRRQKIESIKTEMEKQENELTAQKSTLEAQPLAERNTPVTSRSGRTTTTTAQGRLSDTSYSVGIRSEYWLFAKQDSGT